MICNGFSGSKEPGVHIFIPRYQRTSGELPRPAVSQRCVMSAGHLPPIYDQAPSAAEL
jgi:hypothetical protein